MNARRPVLALVPSLCALALLAAPTLAQNGMKQYWLGLLVRGERASEPRDDAAEIQRGHLANIGRLVETGEMLVAGPFGDDGDLRGLFLYDVATEAEAQALADSDPAVAAGRLAVELHPWWGPEVLTQVPALDRRREERVAREAGAAPRGPVADVADAYLALYEQGDLAGLRPWLADDAEFEDPSLAVRGADAVVDALTEAFATLTIERFDFTTAFESGGAHALRAGRVSFTQDGTTVGRPGTTLRFDVPFSVSLRIVDGQVVRHVDSVDTAVYTTQLMAQLAALPEDGHGR